MLAIIPNECGYDLRGEASPYAAELLHLFDSPPMPEIGISSHAPRTTHHALDS
jgi:hypothetical protein